MSSLLTHVSVTGWLDAAIKSTAVVLLAMVAAGLLGRASAAWRHLVWCLCVASLLLLPILSLALPGWRVTWLPQWAAEPTQAMPVRQTELAHVARAEPLADEPIALPAPAAISEPVRQVQPRVPPPAKVETAVPPRASVPWLAIAWPVGALLSLVPLAIGLWQLAGLQRRSQIIGDHRWLTLLAEVRRQLAVRRSVRLRQCQSALAPLTWGAVRPVLLLPYDSRHWPEDRRRMVLLHELAHVRRWDWLTQLVAHAACAVYWFNPLVWFAARRMRIERERACDDVVLASGARASDYARELLALAASLSNSQLSLLAAMPMAGRVLDDRLHGILDSRRSRRALTRTAVCLGVALAAAAIAPLAMLRAAPPEATELETSPFSSPVPPLDPSPTDPGSAESQTAEPKKDSPAGPVETLEMTVNTSRILTIGKRLPRVQVNNPDVVETTALSETRIKVTAKKPGITQINLFDKDDNVYTADIVIYPDARELRLSPRTQSPLDLESVEGQVEKVDGDRDPLALGNPEVQQLWDLTLEEAVRTALANSKVLRNLGGGLFKPVETQSKLRHAVKVTAEDSKPVRGADVRIFLARTNDDIALADFEIGLRNVLNDVERAYWDLYYNYRNLNAVQAGRDSALATWRKVHALYVNGSKGGEAEADAQAREQYLVFRAQVENTLSLLYTAEGRLRYLMGLAPTDGRLIRPSDDPTTEFVPFDWNEILPEALQSSVELRQQREFVKQNGLKLAEARLAKSGVRNAELTVAQSTARLQDLELEHQHVLTNALRDLNRNYHVSVTTRNRRVAANRQVEAVRAKYEVAAATVDMLLDAQRRLADAEIAYYRALVDYNVAILQVHYRKNSLLEYNGIMLAEGASAESEVRKK